MAVEKQQPYKAFALGGFVVRSYSLRIDAIARAFICWIFGKSPSKQESAGYVVVAQFAYHNPRRVRQIVRRPADNGQSLRQQKSPGRTTNTSGVKFVSANFLIDDWLDNLAKAGFDPRKPTFFLWEGVTYYLNREAMEKTFRTIAMMPPGSVVVFDYGTDANIQRYRKPLIGLLAKAILKAVRESQTFWISSEPPVKKNVTALMEAYGYA